MHLCIDVYIHSRTLQNISSKSIKVNIDNKKNQVKI